MNLEERVERLERRLAGLTMKTLDRVDVFGNANLHGQTILGTYPDNYAQVSNDGSSYACWFCHGIQRCERRCDDAHTGGTLPGIVEWLDSLQ